MPFEGGTIVLPPEDPEEREAWEREKIAAEEERRRVRERANDPYRDAYSQGYRDGVRDEKIRQIGI